VQTFYGQGGSSDADICAFWRKNYGFFEIYDRVFAWRRRERVEPVQTFCRQGGRGSMFCDFVQMSLMNNLYVLRLNG